MLKENLSQNSNGFKRTILISVITILSSQLNINLFFTSNFKISMGIIFLALITFLYKKIDLIPVTIISGLGVFISRVLFHYLKYGFEGSVFLYYFPETTFYLSYGFFLFVFLRIKKKSINVNKVTIPLFIMDYGANLVELLFRINIEAFSYEAQISIILVALVRTIIIWTIISATFYYGVSLISKEHAERYKKLLLLISKLRSEMIWMQKNTALIEDTMNTSYRLYNDLKESDIKENFSGKALNVAKDIHEIKKEYYLIMRGISEALDNELKDEGMYIYEILEILEDSIKKDNRNKTININVNCPHKLYTNKQYLFMSIFRNLITNAVEASNEEIIYIDFKAEMEKNHYLFSVTDYGQGIDEESKDSIFAPGFSTKINYITGEINRGLGLPLVKDIVENQLKGKISVFSLNESTTFTIEIAKEFLEEK